MGEKLHGSLTGERYNRQEGIVKYWEMLGWYVVFNFARIGVVWFLNRICPRE